MPPLMLFMHNRLEKMREVLRERFSPEALSLTDDSASHAGHNPAARQGGTHCTLFIRASAFDRLSRLQIHRMIHETLAPFLKDGLHALAIRAEGVLKRS